MIDAFWHIVSFLIAIWCHTGCTVVIKTLYTWEGEHGRRDMIENCWKSYQLLQFCTQFCLDGLVQICRMWERVNCPNCPLCFICTPFRFISIISIGIPQINLDYPQITNSENLFHFVPNLLCKGFVPHHTKGGKNLVMQRLDWSWIVVFAF